MRLNHVTTLALGLATMTALSACTTSITGTATPESRGAGTSHTSTAATNPGSSTPSDQDRNRAPITLGDLDQRVDAASVGAPYDPCAIGWSTFPAEVRPSDPDAKPVLRPPRDNDGFTVACRYDNGDTVEATVDEQGNSTVNTGRDFLALIVWAKPGQVSTNPADHSGSFATSFSGKQGLLKPGRDSKGNPLCTAIIQLANGVGGVSLTNGRFPQIDTCTITRTVADKIATTAP